MNDPNTGLTVGTLKERLTPFDDADRVGVRILTNRVNGTPVQYDLLVERVTDLSHEILHTESLIDPQE